MSWLSTFLRSTVGAKVVMALTGAAMYGFLIVHMLGNLLIFLGPEYHNHHSLFLHQNADLIWPVRIALLASIVAHVFAWLNLRARSGAARAVPYKVKQNRAATLYARTMKVTGPIILAYVVIHLLNLTFGLWPSSTFRMQAEGFGSPDAYHNTVALLSQPAWGVFYLVCNALLGLHLWHGAYAMARTVGLSSPRQQEMAKAGASALTAAIVGGNLLITASILVGLVK